MVGMKRTYSPSNTLYIAKEGMGYSWLKSTGGPTLKNNLKANPNVKVVLALGVNDLGNIQSYISYYRSLIKAFPKTKFYVLSVNRWIRKKKPGTVTRLRIHQLLLLIRNFTWHSVLPSLIPIII